MQGLRCEYLTNPLGIDAPVPRLTWTLDSPERGARQRAYQILVASGRETVRRADGDLWDSGKIRSNASAHVPYGGSHLRSGRRCWWTVRVWDGNDAVSPWAEPAWWEMGLLQDDDWEAVWVGSPGAASASDPKLDGLVPALYLRAVFEAPRQVARARLYVTARGVYEARLNGRRVGADLMAPGWTNYDTRLQYATHDVTELVREGENVLGAILGTGWYAGYLGFEERARHYGARPQLLAQLLLDYPDGASKLICTDGSWRVSAGPIRYADLYMGEMYDARRKLSGWDTPGYDDRGWEPVEVAGRRRTQRLVAECAEPIRVTQELPPVDITRPADGVQIVDFGQNMVGWVQLRVRGQAGATVRLRFGEMLNADGTLYTENLRTARQMDTYVCRGEGDEVWEPRFTFHGFRYVEVTGYPGALEADAITGRVIGSATPPAGTFECSHRLVNRLQRNVVWGQRGNFLSIPTDCPQRDERLGWLGDAQIFVRTACCNMDVAAFFTKWMRDVEDGQSRSGAFPDVAPRLIVLADGAPAWGDAGVIVPWTIYRCYGDTRIVERHYEAMARWMGYLQASSPGHLRTAGLNNNYGDWLALDAPSPSGPADSATPRELLATAYYAYDARLLARMARAIGRAGDAQRYQQLFEDIKAAFVGAYVDDDGRVWGETQTGYVLALHMDLLPAALRAAAALHLVENIERHDWHLTTGFVGVGYLLPVLTEAGYVDVAYRLLLADTFPSWGYSIARGATTIWERWDGWTEERGFADPGMNSFNHYSLGSVGEWLYRYVAGIDLDPERPGYEQVLIRPHPGGGLTSARAEYRSIRGTIVSDWRRENGCLELRLTIPPNTAATVSMPRLRGDVLEDGRPVRDVVVENGRARFSTPSGANVFVSEVE